MNTIESTAIKEIARYDGTLCQNIAKKRQQTTFLLERNIKNPNFYRNQRMQAIARSIAVIAGAVLASYLSWGAGIPTLTCIIGIPAGFHLVLCFLDIFASYEKDLEKLTQERIQLIQSAEERRKLYETATAGPYSEEAFNALRALDPTIQGSHSNKQEIWDARQEYLLQVKNILSVAWDREEYREELELLRKIQTTNEKRWNFSIKIVRPFS